ncbi:exonuclease [Romboutsia weinsteinii]|uniref:Exonuclease n=1 Tax=Romboutsia weinsteinii TaxID=2020949 RepID=A0A371J9W6_9FIRM|nr:helicase C-terminal domain-containing protein [Romboutsia weinsteinii]RDY29467.1 exonuclease [Romboutsia weinsteinii]
MNLNIISLLDNVVFLDIETSGLDPINSEILEIGAIKIKNGEISRFYTLVKNNKEIPLEILSLCSGLSEEDFSKGKKVHDVEVDLLVFLEDYKVICHNASLEKSFLEFYMPKIKNEIIDSMELAVILEPYHKEYSLDYLKKVLTNEKIDEKHRALDDSLDAVKVVNALLMRLNRKEKSSLEPISFKINSQLGRFSLPPWQWSEFIENADYKLGSNLDVIYEEEILNSENISKEKEIIRKIYSQNKQYEELLKDKEIWASKEGFIYEYRPGQYELTKTIRELFDGSKAGPKIASIEAPTGIGKSVGYLLPAILEAHLNKKRIIISTDTKELQIQLINKDIPNVINSLGLNKKISYGYIKGKNNYICVEKLESYIMDYSPSKSSSEDIIALLYLERLVEEGLYGDIEEINYWIINHFDSLENHIRHISCDPNLCRPKKCIKNCLYKRRVEELKEEDITVINHSLLSKWPYKEEKPIENIIVDEAHNLVEKGYDFFSSIVESRSLRYFLQEIYPYENIKNSPFAYDLANKRFKRNKSFDKFYNHIGITREVKDKISRNINFIVEEMNSILDFGNHSDYKDISRYNLRWELNLQSDEVAGSVYRDNQKKEIYYKEYSEKIKASCESIIRNLASTIITIENYIDDDNVDKEEDIYKFGKSRVKDIEDIKNTLQIFMEYSEEDDFARIVEIDKSYKNFEFRVVPLKLADLFEENILATLSNGIFLSATLSVQNRMNYFKNTLGINRVDNIEKVIEPLYDYQSRVGVIGVSDICSYQNKDFTKEMSDFIANTAETTQGHMLSLFNSKERQEKTYEDLKDKLHLKNIEIYMNKRGIKYLKDINKRCVVLGSKGCFEGVDVPGDGLTCVTLDKIPNLNPRDPLYSTIIKKYNKTYNSLNYPQMAIKVKQAMGRLLRSKYDYGCFIIFNTGTNINNLKKLEKDLHGCKIYSMSIKNIDYYINNHFRRCRSMILKSSVVDVFEELEYIKNKEETELEKYINKEMKNRSIKIQAFNMDESRKTFKVKYFDITYLINKDKIKLELKK